MARGSCARLTAPAVGLSVLRNSNGAFGGGAAPVVAAETGPDATPAPTWLEPPAGSPDAPQPSQLPSAAVAPMAVMTVPMSMRRQVERCLRASSGECETGSRGATSV